MIEGNVMEKKPALTMQQLGGLARAKKLSDTKRSEIARMGGRAKWDKNHERPPLHRVVRHMLDTLDRNGGTYSLFLDRAGNVKYTEANSNFEKLWLLNDRLVGTYAPGAKFSDVLTDIMVMV